jgi:linoleoyl-CoA desaturase
VQANPSNLSMTPHSSPEFLQLRKKFQELGFFRPAAGTVLAQFMAHLVVCMFGLLLTVQASTIPVKLLGLIVSTVGMLGVATNTHTASHNASTRNRWLNRALLLVGYPFLVQLSATYWVHKHVIVHHPVPNVVGLDDDIDFAPWFAITDTDYQNATGLTKFWYDVQWLIFPIAVLLNGFNAQVTGWKFLLNKLFSRDREVKHWCDLGAMLAHIGVWVILPMFYFDPLCVLLLYAARIGLMGYAMFITFAPAHFPEEASAVAASNRSADFALIQCANTLNFRTGPIGRLVCSGLDYQIEHHLFPTVSHVYYPQMSPYVQDFCARLGYPYRTLSWLEAIWKSFAVMKHRKSVHARVNDFVTPSG